MLRFQLLPQLCLFQKPPNPGAPVSLLQLGNCAAPVSWERDKDKSPNPRTDLCWGPQQSSTVTSLRPGALAQAGQGVLF